MEKLADWNYIRHRFDHTIVLGNGASIAIDQCFAYASLYEEASKRLLLDAPLGGLFERYKTTDFEFILSILWRTHQINDLFKVHDDEVAKAYSLLREALIQTVQQVHVGYAAAVDHLPAIGRFLRQFKNVISLNYDLLTYWAMLNTNQSLGGAWFKDCFIHEGRAFEDDYEWLRKPYGKVSGTTLVFYPHGNLILATDILGRETKIVSDEKTDLLETIVNRWSVTDATPLFVSEGTSTQKLQSIHRNGYLRTVYNNVVQDLGENAAICVYGWSMSSQDQHLLEALGKNKPKHLAVSVYTGSDPQVFCNEVRARLEKTYGFKYTNIVFFDSQSEGMLDKGLEQWLTRR